MEYERQRTSLFSFSKNLPVHQGCSNVFFGGPDKDLFIGALGQNDDTFLEGGCPPGHFLKFGSLKWHFVHFEGAFVQNLKVLNGRFFNSVYQYVGY